MRISTSLVLGAIALAAIGCGEEDPYFEGSPSVAEKAPDGGEWRRLRTVRPFNPSQRLTPAEERLTRRIIARDKSLAPLLRDADGHAVVRVGSVTVGGRAALVGGIAEVRLTSPVTGTYRLPAACGDLDGEYIPVGPYEFRFKGVASLHIQVGFADRAVFEAQPMDGDFVFSGDPGTWPQSCRDAAERSRGA